MYANVIAPDIGRLPKINVPIMLNDSLLMRRLKLLKILFYLKGTFNLSFLLTGAENTGPKLL